MTTSIQPEPWVDHAGAAVLFYQAGLGATVMHRLGKGDDIVAQLSVGDGAFWVTAAATSMKRFSPNEIDGTTSRTLLVVEDPERMMTHAVVAGATETSPVGDAGWRLGRTVDRSATSGRSANLWRRGSHPEDPPAGPCFRRS